MPTLNDAALDSLLEEAGLTLSDALRQELKDVQPALTAMKQRVRQPRGRMAELAHVYGFTAEDLA